MMQGFVKHCICFLSNFKIKVLQATSYPAMKKQFNTNAKNIDESIFYINQVKIYEILNAVVLTSFLHISKHIYKPIILKI